ncbi:MAG: hypothetical protein ACKOGJ_01400, partial [Phycisphaerales bacterium]
MHPTVLTAAVASCALLVGFSATAPKPRRRAPAFLPSNKRTHPAFRSASDSEFSGGFGAVAENPTSRAQDATAAVRT